MTPLRTIPIRHARGSYQVSIGACIGRTGELTREALPQARRAAIVIDPRVLEVAPGLASSLEASLREAHFEVHRMVPTLGGATRSEGEWTSSETHKSLEVAEGLAKQIASAGLDRRDVVVAVGGGLLTDIAGLAAALYRRGIAWIPSPTTLLAMVDASVGGKTGANLGLEGSGAGQSLLKNMVGVFHQPAHVLVDPAWLATLEARQLACGLAECIKHAMIASSVMGTVASQGATGSDSSLGGPDAARAAIDRWRAAGAVSGAGVLSLLEFNIALKARVVEQDEFEVASDATGGRALLNLGHTFGHAIEALGSAAHSPEYVGTPVLHGEAVGLGLIAATATSAALGMVQASQVGLVRSVVAHAQLPTRLHTRASIEDLLSLMRQDKKTLSASLRLVLPTGMSSARVVSDPDPRAIVSGWETIVV